MFGSQIAGHVVASVIVKVNALQIADVAIAIRQQHVECGIVDNEAIEIDGASGNTALIP